MPKFNLPRILQMVAILWLAFLMIGAILSPPNIGYDAGNGVLDLLNFKDGGQFQHHSGPAINQESDCREGRTTWWSPGQWFFAYMINLLGVPLGYSYSLLAILCIGFGVFGWTKVFQKFSVKPEVIYLAACIMLFSRFNYSQVMIFSGASVLEFGLAPWIFLLWFWFNEKPLLLRLASLIGITIAGYFVKSSLLILILGLTLHSAYMAFKQERRWGVVFLFPSAFVIGKFACDLLFVGQGRTPFDIESHWFLEFEEPMLEWAQSLAFILSSPLTSGFGLEDYINYVFQRPGAELLSDGSPGLVMMYGTLAILSAVLVAHFFLFNEKVKSEYKEYLFFIGGVSLGFVAFSWLASKPISVAEESRHIRVAGLLFLPVVLTYLNQFLKKLTWLVPICLLIYGLNSHWSKMTRDKVILPEMKFALSEIADKDAWDMFSELVDSSDFYYVINADWMFPHDQCRGFFNHDDFRSVEGIANRPDVKLDGESIVFLFPARFRENGKQDAIIGNFQSANPLAEQSIEVISFDDFDIIQIVFSEEQEG